jgi:hypothetical protein
MPARPFEEVWARIVSHAGVVFRTPNHHPFTYVVRGDGVYTSRSSYRIPRTDFAKAYELVPIETPGEIEELVAGAAYVWAILHDRKISQGMW